MSIKTNFFDGNSVAAADLIAQWAAMLSDGVFGATDFAASADSPADLAVSVAIGRAIKDGHFIRSDAAEKVPISANTSGYNRIDIIVLQVDDTNNSTTLTVVQGTPSSSPTAPILQANQLPLAQVTAGNNVSVIDSSAITDIRPSAGLTSNIKAQIQAQHSVTSGENTITIPTANGNKIFKYSTTPSLPADGTVCYFSVPFPNAADWAMAMPLSTNTACIMQGWAKDHVSIYLGTAAQCVLLAIGH